MTKPELNAVIAGLRFLQSEYWSWPDNIRALYLDGIKRQDALTPADIDALCERLNFADLKTITL